MHEGAEETWKFHRMLQEIDMYGSPERRLIEKVFNIRGSENIVYARTGHEHGAGRVMSGMEHASLPY